MKKTIIAVTAAITLLTGSAVSAAEFKHSNHGHKVDYSHHDSANSHGHNNHNNHNNCNHSECANSGYCLYR